MSRQNSYTLLNSSQQIDAICWAANQAGMSYGEFCTGMTVSMRAKAFFDYELVLRQRATERKAEEERLKHKQRSRKRAGKK